MPRGRALGMVMQLPEGDQTSRSRRQLLAFMDICMGGRVAEELVFGYDNVTTGASSDIQQATRIAKQMVTQVGLSDKLGIIHVDVDDNKQKSSKLMNDIDEEVRALLLSSYERARKILTEHRQELNILAEGLMTYESLSGEEVEDLLKGKKPHSDKEKRSQRASRSKQSAGSGSDQKADHVGSGESKTKGIKLPVPSTLSTSQPPVVEAINPPESATMTTTTATAVPTPAVPTAPAAPAAKPSSTSVPVMRPSMSSMYSIPKLPPINNNSNTSTTAKPVVDKAAAAAAAAAAASSPPAAKASN